MKLISCVIFLAPLFSVVTSDQTCKNGNSQIKLSNQSEAYQFQINELKSYGVGIWTRFLPYQKEHKMDDPVEFMILQALDGQNRKVMEYWLSIESSAIRHRFKVYYLDFNYYYHYQDFSKIQFEVIYEGGWMLSYQLVDLQAQQQYFYIFLVGIPSSKIILTGYPIFDNRTASQFISNTFPGQKSELIFNDNIPVLTREQFQQYAYGCTFPVTCREQTVVNLINGAMLFKNKIVTSTIFYKTPKYLVRGWIKLDKVIVIIIIVYNEYCGDENVIKQSL